MTHPRIRIKPGQQSTGALRNDSLGNQDTTNHERTAGYFGNLGIASCMKENSAIEMVTPAVSRHEGVEPPSATGAESSLARKDRLATEVRPFAPGLTVVLIHDQGLLLHARHALTDQVLQGSSEIGIPMSKVDRVVSVLSGNKRQLEQARLFSAAHPVPSGCALHDVKTYAAREALDWTSNEGQCVIVPMISEAQGWVIAEQKVNGPITPAITQGLIVIGNAAQQVGVKFMLFVTCHDRQAAPKLMHVGEEYLEVAPCEPDFGSDLAFSIDCVGIRSLHGLGIGKAMCNVALNDGVFTRRYSRFISADLETRIMWALRSKGMTLDEIGSILNIHKSTVLRRLYGLPTPRLADVDQDWLHRNLESILPKPS